MKFKHFIPITITIGLITLFFFPEPESNFLAYILTALSFTGITIFLIIKRNN